MNMYIRTCTFKKMWVGTYYVVYTKFSIETHTCTYPQLNKRLGEEKKTICQITSLNESLKKSEGNFKNTLFGHVRNYVT